MTNLYHQLLQLLARCRDAVAAIQPRGGAYDHPSQKTRADYLRLGKTLLHRARYAEHGLRDVLTNTTRTRTFHTRMAALRSFLHVRQRELMASVHQASDEQLQSLQPELEQHLQALEALVATQSAGFQGMRKKRQSKRKALAGLPWDWREKLCQRSQAGSYGKAILAAAVSGCRPIELQMGIVIWRDYDETLQTDMINIFVNGAKVKGQHQGQPWRIIHYVATDDHPLSVATNKLLDQQEEPNLHVQIPNPGNFTVEVRRLGKCLWPAHRHSITAYCLRHQWAADIKSTRSADSVSRGLGHVSAKTRRNYGQAQQASKAGALRPLAVTVERSIKPLSTKPPLSKARSSAPQPEMT